MGALPVMARLLRRARLSSWLSWRCSLDLVAAVAAGDRSGLLSFLKRRGGGAANSFWKEEEEGKRVKVRLFFLHTCFNPSQLKTLQERLHMETRIMRIL